MKLLRPSLFCAAFGAMAAACLVGPVIATPQAAMMDAAQLKSMLQGLGYEVKDLNTEAGKEKYQFTITKKGFDVPLGAEFSASKNFIWVTAFLGKAPEDSSPKNAALLKQNFSIQPSFFWVTEKGNLMIGVAMENRAMTPAIFKRHTDKLSDDVVATADVWGK